MTKAKSKSAKRRLRKGRKISLPGGDVVQLAPARGPRPAEPPADLVALHARARLTGCSIEDARDVLASEPITRCIRYMRPGAEDRRALLSIWQGISASWHNYAARCLSITPSPQSASLPMLPEPMQTDQSLRVDLRSAEERDSAARASWLAWLEALMSLPADQRHALRGHLHGYGAEVWNDADRTPTRAGALAIKALAALDVARRT